jgi:hypothetical protein
LVPHLTTPDIGGFDERPTGCEMVLIPQAPT